MKIRPTTGEKREDALSIKMGDAEMEILDVAAKLCGMNVSLFVANTALKHACEICMSDVQNKYDYIVSKIQPLILKETENEQK